MRIASLWNLKATAWVKGRKGGLDEVRVKMSALKGPIVWVHCASLGEFEQARPIMQEIKTVYPHYSIALTFFSPSGYQIRKNYEGVDAVLYLPMDNPVISQSFINILNPSLVIWVKYEYWYHYLRSLQRSNIPVLLVSGIFRAEQPFFKWYGQLWRQMLNAFTHLFVQNEESIQLLKTISLKPAVTLCGDTRFDRVLAIAQNETPVPDVIQKFCNGKAVVVCGSTWPEDEIQFIHYVTVHQDKCFIIAPHEISKANLKDILMKFPTAVLLSSLQKNESVPPLCNVLIIDNIGMLAALYRIATICYVGGGFNDSGIHNILEPAVYGKPIIIGPEYSKFAEAAALVDAGGAFVSDSPLELEACLNMLFGNTHLLIAAGEASGSYVEKNTGATRKIMEYIQEKRLLTS